MNRRPSARWLRSLTPIATLLLATIATAAPLVSALEAPGTGLQLGIPYELGDSAIKASVDARALTLAAGDVDGDGFPDLISGYALAQGGVLTLHRGNREAWAPTLTVSHALLRHGMYPAGFEMRASTVPLPVPPELVVAGDFDQDGAADVVLAQRGDAAVYLLRGGRDGLSAPEKFAQPGTVDALAAGHIDRADGRIDLAVAVSGKAGASLRVYAAGLGGAAHAERLPAPASELQIAQLDGDRMGDVLVLADGRVGVLHGRDRAQKSTFDSLEALDLPFAVRALASGDFIWDRAGSTELALLKDDGSVHLAARGELDTTPFTLAEIRAKRRAQIDGVQPAMKSWRPGIEAGWRIAQSLPAQMSKAATDAAPRLVAARFSNRPSDDLLIVDALGRSIAVHVREGAALKSALLPVSEAPVALLALQTSAFVRPSLVILGAKAGAATLVPSAPTAVFGVSKTADTNDGSCDSDCSLREAIVAANANAGADSILITSGDYRLTRTNTGGVNEDNAATGDLDINDDLALVRVGAGLVTVSGGSNTSDGIDKVFAVNPFCTGPVNVTLSDFTIRFGRNSQPNLSGDFSDTGGGIDVCNTGGGTFTMTGMVVRENSVLNSYGGGVNLDSVAPATGTYTITGGSIQQNATTSAAAILKNGGGINLFGDAHNVNITNATISQNTSAAEGGGVYARHTNGGTITLSGSTISGNTAASRGGGLTNNQLGAASLVINNDSAIGSNTSQGTAAGTESRGGGVFISSAGATTIRETTITGNFATGANFGGGGGIAATAGTITAQFNRIAGNSAGAAGGSGFHNAGGTLSGSRNWWGCNAGPFVGPCDIAVATVPSVSPHMVLRHIASPGAIVVGQTSTLTADFLTDSVGGAIAVADLDALIGTTHTMNNAVRGTLSGVQGTIQASGTATGTFTATTPGAGSADSVVDAHAQPVAITINQAATTTTITAHTPDPSLINTAVTVNFSVVVNAPGAAAITGNVTVSDGVDTCVAAATAGTCNITLTTAGSRSLVATYAGNTNLAGSASAPVAHTVVTCPSVVTNGNDSGAGSLRDVIANACEPSTITFQAGVTSVTLTSAEILVNKNLTINGGAGVTVARSSAGGTPNFRIFNVQTGKTVSMNNLTVSNGNHPVQAGGIQNSGTLTLTDVAIRGNTSPQAGGIQNDGVLTMTGGTISGNTGTSFGGGLIIAGSSTTLSNCTISNNNGGSDSGGIGAAGVLSVTNCTIANNQVTSTGAGITVNSADVTLRNTIVAQNTTTGPGAANIDGTLNLAGSINNLVGTSGRGGLTNGVNGNLVVANAVLAALANNGGPTETIALLPGSPAINAGTNVGAPATDQRGIARPQQGTVDIGAFESRGFTMALTSGDAQTAIVSTAFANPLVATVSAIAPAEPVQGGRVTFTPPGAGASAVIATSPATINASGVASVNATANATVGSYSVVASSTGSTGVSFALQNRLASADLSITKTDGVTTAVPGASVTYTITASNAGPDPSNATVADTFPAIQSCTWTCAPSGGASCAANGSGNINDAVFLPVSGTATYTAVCNIAASATGTMVNTATVSGPLNDSNPGNNSATDVDTLTPTADLSITKTDGSATATPGSSTTYTIVASNAGPSNAPGATVADTFPATLTCNWTCVGAGGGTCTAGGSGNISDTVNLPAGGSTTYTAVCAISGAASGTLSNTTTVAAPGGVTDPNPGNNSATDTDTLVAGPPSQLAFGQQPVNTAGGATITPSPTVRILDQFGNLTTSTANVTIAIGTNPAGGTLSGTTTVAAVAGVATFNGLSINTAGTGYTLAASSTGLTGATSSAFNITVGPAVQLAFGQQPTNSTANVAIAPAPTVRILDAGGNLTASTANVTVAIGTNPGPGTLGGTLTVAASAGVATFPNLTIDAAGIGYTLTAASAGLTGATSNAFNVACAPSVVTNGNDSGAGSLRQTIADACAGSTITFAGGVSNVGLTTAELLVNKNLTIDGGAGVTVARVAGSPNFRIVNIAGGRTVAIIGLTISNGNTTGLGGGIFSAGSLTLTNSAVTGNSAGTNFGGGLYTQGPTVIDGCTISGNQAGNGGGLFHGFSTLTLSNTTVSNNTTQFQGAGVNIQDATATLANCTVSNNQSVNSQAGVAHLVFARPASTLTLTNCTVADNVGPVTAFGGIWTAYGPDAPGQTVVTRLQNTLVANNSPEDFTTTIGSADIRVPTPNAFLASLGNNLDSDGTSGFVDGVNGDRVGSVAAPINALLAPLGNYAGPTQTRALLPGSPAINAGNNAACAAAPVSNQDQRGVVRPQQTTCDIGAFESRGYTLTLTGGNNQSAGPGLAFANPLTATVTAIEAAEPVQGGVVTFTPPGAGPSASLAPNPAPIGAGGVASTTATANMTVGAYNVTAAANGATPTLSYALTNAGADLSIDDVTVTETNAGSSNAVFTVTRTNSLTAFSVPYSITAGTAQAGSDYTTTSGTLNFAVGGPLTQTISVPVVGDLIVEATETATLNLGAVTNTTGVTTVTDSSGLLTIDDNDSAVVAFNPVSVSQGEASSPMAFTVTLSNPVQSGVTLVLNSANVTATAADYTPIVGGSVSFAPNSSASQTVNVTINNDLLDEDDETFTLTLSGLTAVGNVTSGTLVATGTIVDDDLPPVISITSPSQLEGDLGNSPMDFVVSLSAVSGRDVSFTRATADGTATVLDNDYLPLAPAVLTIPAGQLGTTITVQIVGNTIFEGNESFSLNLTGIANATPASLTGTGTIEDDDQQPTVTTITSDGPDPSVVGQPYNVVVNVAAVTTSPLGTVTISDGTDSCGPVALTTGTAPNSSASCVLTSTTAGAKTLTASYTAASTAFADSSGTTTHQVNAAATTISVTGPPRSRINQPTTFSFALSVNAPGAGTPAGTVTLSSGAASCNVTVPTATPSCALTFSTLGSRTVSAAFVPADGNFLGSTSSGAGNAQTLVYAISDIAVTKSNGVGTYQPGELLVYTVAVTNAGPDDAAQIRIIDNIPVGLVDVVWSCDASGGVACPVAGGSGNLDFTVTSFPVGGQLNITFFGNVDGNPAQLVNTAQIELPADTTIEDPVPGNNSASDTDIPEFLFRNGFESAIVNGPQGSQRLSVSALRASLDQVARVVYLLDDAEGEALRVYARLFDGEVQYALAGRSANGALRLGTWRTLPGDPLLTWTAAPVADGWRLVGAELR